VELFVKNVENKLTPMNDLNEKLMKIYLTNGISETSKITGLSFKKIIEKLDLDVKTFDDIDFDFNQDLKGKVGRIVFDNGYGASVVSHQFSYGGKDGLFELAVLDKNGKLTYDTPITDDVIGYLTPEKVTEILIQIQDLKN